MTVPDQAAIDLMKRLARPVGNDPAVVAGESAVAGLAGALAARRDPAMAQALGLDASSRLLVFGSEGATDPALYQQLTGLRPQDVERRQ
jgi:diaminopropionate ammonia-lyase